jgi:hypothetical protein
MLRLLGTTLILLALSCAGEPTTHPDLDGDGYCVDPSDVWVPGEHTCEGAQGFGDCDDADPDHHPATPELCNGLDDNCDGWVDDDEADLDGDGELACATDCDDLDGDRGWTASEWCNELDDDCDGAVDEGDDDDGDGWPAWSCVQEEVDCEDWDDRVFPGAQELCNRRDDDCDGVRDNGVEVPVWYFDADGDGYAVTGASTTTDCEPDSYWSARQTGDCNDNRDWIHPNAPELCNLLDDDCDGLIDDGWSNPVRRYLDQDGDGHGRASSSAVGCGDAPGYSPTSDDCDDTNASVSPSAVEVDNGGDDDCDELIDED